MVKHEPSSRVMGRRLSGSWSIRSSSCLVPCPCALIKNSVLPGAKLIDNPNLLATLRTDFAIFDDSSITWWAWMMKENTISWEGWTNTWGKGRDASHMWVRGQWAFLKLWVQTPLHHKPVWMLLSIRILVRNWTIIRAPSGTPWPVEVHLARDSPKKIVS